MTIILCLYFKFELTKNFFLIITNKISSFENNIITRKKSSEIKDEYRLIGWNQSNFFVERKK